MRPDRGAGGGRVSRPNQLPTPLALLPAADLRGPVQGNGEDLLQPLVAVDLAPKIANDPAQAGAQELDLPVHALELLGVNVAPGLHRRRLGDAGTRGTSPRGPLRRLRRTGYAGHPERQ